MAWTFINSAVATAGNNPSVDITGLPSAGDLLVYVVSAQVSAVTVGPSGFTNRIAYTTNLPFIYVYTKTASGSETTLGVTGGGTASRAAILIYRNILSIVPDATSTVVTSGGANVTSSATNTLTSTAADDLVISIWTGSKNTITADAATTVRVNNAGSASSLTIADENLAAVGSSTSRTATMGSQAVNNVALAFTQTILGGNLFFGSNF